MIFRSDSKLTFLISYCKMCKSCLSGSILVSSCFFVLLARVSYGCSIDTLWASLHMWNSLCMSLLIMWDRLALRSFSDQRGRPRRRIYKVSHAYHKEGHVEWTLKVPSFPNSSFGCSNRFGLRLGATSNECLRGTRPQVHPEKQKVHIHACTWDSCTKLDSSF